MADIGDLVLQTANAPGTATFSLIAPVTGRVSFVSGVGAGSGKYYVAHDGTNWEKGNGTVTAGSPDTLSRDTVIRNSLGTTARINFSSTVTLISDIPAERAIYAVADNGSVVMSGRVFTGLAAGFAADHSIRWDQSGGIRVGTYSASGGSIIVPLPNGTDTYELQLSALVGAAAAPMYFRVSTNGGTSYLSGATEYGYINQASVGSASPVGTSGNISYAPIGVQNVASFGLYGTLIIHPFFKIFRTDTQSFTGSALTREQSSGNWTTSGTVTNIQISAVSSSLTSGSARLVQRA